jgi:hypothetical protein
MLNQTGSKPKTMKKVTLPTGRKNRLLPANLFNQMKAIILSMSLILTVGVTGAFAHDRTPVSDQVQESFNKEFAGAEAVNWKETGEYLKASFVLRGHRAEAYFNKEGELQGCVRDLFFDQLPLSVMTSMDKRFANADIIQVREITNTEGTSYVINLEYRDKKYRVGVSSGGYITGVNKERKKK